MKYVIITKYYLFLLIVAISVYVLLYILGCFIIYSRFVLESNFGFISDVLKTIIGNAAYFSPSFLMVEVTAIMGSGYTLGKVTDDFRYNNKACGQAFLLVLFSVTIFFIVIFFSMIFSETQYWFFDYLVTIISPILFVLPLGANY